MSAQEDMVERVARAIYDAADKSGEYVGDFEFHRWCGDRCTTLDGAFDLRVFARAAIEAMRVPTEAMVNAGAVADADGNLAADARNTWRAMIDAALPSSPGVKEG